MTLTAIIPIRKNSKGVINKNIKKLGSKPLCYYVINSALKSKIFNKIIISSDSSRYFKILKKYFSSKKIYYHSRSKKNSRDKSSSENVIKEVISFYKIQDVIYLIQATSPFLKKDDLINSFKKYEKKKYDSLLSVFKSKNFFWAFKNKQFRSLNYDFRNRPRRQEFKKHFFGENGAFYVFTSKGFLKNKNRLYGKIGYYVMDTKNSLEIDSIDDFKIAKNYINNK